MKLYVSDLSRSSRFCAWFLGKPGNREYQRWDETISRRLGSTYLVFVRTEPRYLQPPYHRRRTGLNHLAFHARSREEVDRITGEIRWRGGTVLYEDRHPHTGGRDHYAVYFEDPDRIQVELVAPE